MSELNNNVENKKVSSFEELLNVDVSSSVEKKGKFNYLSWAVAVRELKKKYPGATWNVKRFEGMPYMKTELGYFVEVEVEVEGIALSQIHPVLNNYNKPIEKPSAFDINNSIQRCLAKAIALHGLGLNIYTGEDLVQYENENNNNNVRMTTTNNDKPSDAQLKFLKSLMTKNNIAFTESQMSTLSKSKCAEMIKKLNEK